MLGHGAGIGMGPIDNFSLVTGSNHKTPLNLTRNFPFMSTYLPVLRLYFIWDGTIRHPHSCQLGSPSNRGMWTVNVDKTDILNVSPRVADYNINVKNCSLYKR